MTDKPLITAERLREVLHYDPETGVFTWKVATARKINIGDVAGNRSHGYVWISIDSRRYAAHRLAWLYVTGAWPREQIDHINAQREDNRFRNLREATLTENNRNVPLQKNNKSGRKGVYWHRGACKWTSAITVNRRTIYLGLFTDLEEAGTAYAEAARQYFGEFARHR